jgi:redox-sensitive bicupin YhaK (pirin superfamily)
MTYRKPKVFTGLQYMDVGPFEVKQPLPGKGIEQVSPFILLHHAGPSHHEPGTIDSRLAPHPHRGFEPVTFLFSGKLHHKDSTGSEGFLETGDVQWMTSGSGIIHSEGPSEAFAREGGDMELIQLWVNLPRDHKMTAPKYQDIKSGTMPVISENGFDLKLVAGELGDKKGPASTFTPILALMGSFKKGGKIDIPVPEGYQAMVYLLAGNMVSNGVEINSMNLAVMEQGGDAVELSAVTDGKLLFLAGEPIHEPVVSYGPFVMNYPGEIKQAILDYETGKMGELIN